MSAAEIILVGGGGHCRSAIDVILSHGGFQIAGILDLPAKLQEQVLDYPITGTEEDIERLAAEGKWFVVTIGHMKSSALRIKTFEKIKFLSGRLATIQSADAVVSPYAVIGEGSIVFHKAVVNAGARMGVNSIINTGAIIEHDTVVGDHCHISTGAIINGGCGLGNRIFAGSGTIVREGITVCDDVFIGAGSVVTRSITEPGIYYGSPAKRKN